MLVFVELAAIGGNWAKNRLFLLRDLPLLRKKAGLCEICTCLKLFTKLPHTNIASFQFHWRNPLISSVGSNKYVVAVRLIPRNGKLFAVHVD